MYYILFYYPLAVCLFVCFLRRDSKEVDPGVKEEGEKLGVRRGETTIRMYCIEKYILNKRKENKSKEKGKMSYKMVGGKRKHCVI